MRDLKVTPIRNGTVIDHIPSGMALKVLRVLGISGEGTSTVSILMHVPSKKRGAKDILKIEDRELLPKELSKIAFIAPEATINIIRNYNVAEKHTVELPERVVGILTCGNPNCISNTKEPIESVFLVRSRNPLRVRCQYCDRELDDVTAHVL
jgi:aspartate carbamoyltransferase regulatory subunit